MGIAAATGAWTGKRTHKWTAGPVTTANPTTSTLSASRLSDKTVQVFGTFGAGATLTIQGSNDGGTTWFSCNDSRGEGNPLDFTTAGGADGRAINENPDMLRGSLAGGDGTTSLTIIITSSSVAG